MTRLIDADRLKAHVKMQTDLVRNFSSISELGELATVMADGFEREVDIQPTVEAEPVRHGKWDKGTDSCWHICEECGAEVDISMGTGVWVEGVELYELNYCPNCGAKMDGEE